MTTVQQVYEGMQRLAPPELAEHWDNPGLLVDCGGAVRRVLVTLDITPEVVATSKCSGYCFLQSGWHTCPESPALFYHPEKRHHR